MQTLEKGTKKRTPMQPHTHRASLRNLEEHSSTRPSLILDVSFTCTIQQVKQVLKGITSGHFIYMSCFIDIFSLLFDRGSPFKFTEKIMNQTRNSGQMAFTETTKGHLPLIMRKQVSYCTAACMGGFFYPSKTNGICILFSLYILRKSLGPNYKPVSCRPED